MPDTENLSTDDLLRIRLSELAGEKAGIEQSTLALRTQRDALNAQIEELKAQQAALTDEINAAERPRILEIAEEMSRVAKALGGRSMGEGAR